MADLSTDKAALDQYLEDPRFRQSFTLPPDPSRDRFEPLEVTYADFGYRNKKNPQEENVLLFFAPLMSSRLLHVGLDSIAKQHKVRIIDPDRPGFGGTTQVSDDKRMHVWADVVPALLQHLGIQHVAVACHSGGTVYAMDTLLHHPEILHPERPYLAIGAPWILPSRSGIITMSITQALPSSLFSHTDKVVSFVQTSLSPSLASSFGISQAAMKLFNTPNPNLDISPEDSPLAQWEEALEPRIVQHIHKEGIPGISSESIVLMQKLGTSAWGTWKDYDELIPRLRAALRAAGRTLFIDTFFAESDSMIGDACTEGPDWFDACWKREDPEGPISYSSSVIPDTEHDKIWTLRMGLPQKVLQRVGRED
ncbi:unnamed protein product [Clonostachys rosea f. rosea IK726]|uniref:Uncharacterized protein n=1 Tax=Clonostachys rosea f. rosea IK726 TaxID=1349383 RepID=A0ACA9U693_BIOOC|nr:unnamed protein product [Clonostachys rosea f. rosea IK726]